MLIIQERSSVNSEAFELGQLLSSLRLSEEREGTRKRNVAEKRGEINDIPD